VAGGMRELVSERGGVVQGKEDKGAGPVGFGPCKNSQ
jgi:hypothetical protein